MKIINRKARFNYQILESFEAGVVLSGAEVKAVRAGNINLTNSFAKIINGEAYLVNAIINPKNTFPSDTARARKLLLHKKEIGKIETQLKAKKLTLVPISIYTRGQLVKVKIALAKSKKKHEKRESIKKRGAERDIKRELK